jgi:hypothetical protein
LTKDYAKKDEGAEETTKQQSAKEYDTYLLDISAKSDRLHYLEPSSKDPRRHPNWYRKAGIDPLRSFPDTSCDDLNSGVDPPSSNDEANIEEMESGNISTASPLKKKKVSSNVFGFYYGSLQISPFRRGMGP